MKASLLKVSWIGCVMVWCCCWIAPEYLHAQCNPYFSSPLSVRRANYDINVKLDHEKRHITARQTISFTNHAMRDTVTYLRLYMYLNSFKNTESTFLKGAANIFGQSFTDRKADEWGWAHVERFVQDTVHDLSAGMRYVQPDDGNTGDQSVLHVPLSKPLLPGQTAVFTLDWQAQVPKTIARCGYNQDFYLFCHWFPQLGVWQQGSDGKFEWNCHQFHRRTEFYADFGVYDVHITTPDVFVLGASGCLVSKKSNGDGTNTVHYLLEDAIDFAWSIYPKFEEVTERWRDVQIKLLIPQAHAYMAQRYMNTMHFALEYLDKHVGKYPYPSITVVDPPFHGLRSGMMEYPTLITTATIYGMPAQVRTMESLVVHEFVHQYFMGMVASNEKEEAWLDEGFVTYYEDRITDALFGERGALVDAFGVKVGNSELSRVEYTTMANPRLGPVARPGWEFQAVYKELIYSKTATSLRTVDNLLGRARMDKLIQAYFERWKFGHPKGADFLTVLEEHCRLLPDTTYGKQVFGLFRQAIYDSKVLDYGVKNITNQTLFATQGIFGDNPANLEHRDGKGERKLRALVEVQRLGDVVFPVEVLVHFEDGTQQNMQWSGVEPLKVFEIDATSPVVSVEIDPLQKLRLDIDLNNNSLNLRPDKTPLLKYTAKLVYWLQTLLQFI